MWIPFAKLHGIGNDFVLIEADQVREADLPAAAAFIADRRYGIGCDQLLLLEPGDAAGADLHMRVLNADGSEAEMCGNGIRAFAAWAWMRGLADPARPLRVATGAGLREVRRIDAWTSAVDMGSPGLEAGTIALDPTAFGLAAGAEARDLGRDDWPPVGPGRAISMGNPHLVFRNNDVDAIPLADWGRRIERDPAFPQRINVEFVEVRGPGHLRVRVWERGAGATLACGTGACAAAVAALAEGWVDTAPVRIDLPGGTLEVDWQPGETVWLRGSATLVATGELNLEARQDWQQAWKEHVRP